MLLLILKLFWLLNFFLENDPGPGWSQLLAVSPQKFWGTPMKSLICLTIIRSAFQELPFFCTCIQWAYTTSWGTSWSPWVFSHYSVVPIINALVHRSRIMIVNGFWAEMWIMLMVLTLCCHFIYGLRSQATLPVPQSESVSCKKRCFSLYKLRTGPMDSVLGRCLKLFPSFLFKPLCIHINLHDSILSSIKLKQDR